MDDYTPHGPNMTPVLLMTLSGLSKLSLKEIARLLDRKIKADEIRAILAAQQESLSERFRQPGSVWPV